MTYIQESVYYFLCSISVCPFVSLLKATYAKHFHSVCLVDIKKRSFVTSCVFQYRPKRLQLVVAVVVQIVAVVVVVVVIMSS